MHTKITELRKSGNLQEAYNLSIQEYKKDKDNKYINSSYGWVLYSLIKEKLEKNDLKGLESYINTLNELDIEQGGEVDMYEMLSGQFYKNIKTINDISQYKLALYYYFKLKSNKPSKIHSYILFDVLNKYKKNDNSFQANFDFYGFIKLWGIQNFQYEDYEEGEYNGKATQSTFEKVIGILGNIIKNTDDINILGDVLELKILLQKGIDRELKWAGYYLGKLKLLKGDYKEAEKLILKVVKKEKNQFWSWDLLGKVLLKQGYSDLYFSALSKALSCGNDDKFLNNLREDYIYELLEKNLIKEANIELNHIIQNKIKNDVKITEKVDKLTQNSWYIKVTSGSNKSFYDKNIEMIEEYLYSDIEDRIIYVDFINKDKNILNFKNKNRTKGFFNFKNLKDVKVEKGDVIKAKIEKIDNEYHNVYKIYDDKYHLTDIFGYDEVLIDYINKDKKIINFVGSSNHGFFNYRGYECIIENLNVGHILSTLFIEKKDEFYHIGDLKKSDNQENSDLKKEINGEISIREGNDFGFLGDIFVGGNLLNGIKDGDYILGEAIKSYNKKKCTVGWKIISLEGKS